MLSRRDGLVAVNARHSILSAECLINMTSQQSELPFATYISQSEFDTFIGNVVVWDGGENLCRDGMVYASSTADNSPREPMQHSPGSLDEWKNLWRIGENQSLAAKIEFAEKFGVDDRRHFQVSENPLDAGAVQ